MRPTLTIDVGAVWIRYDGERTQFGVFGRKNSEDARSHRQKQWGKRCVTVDNGLRGVAFETAICSGHTDSRQVRSNQVGKVPVIHAQSAQQSSARR